MAVELGRFGTLHTWLHFTPPTFALHVSSKADPSAASAWLVTLRHEEKYRQEGHASG